MIRRDVVIVGSGPAGSATALGIVARDPALAAGTVMLEKAIHPRDKTCAGGVIPKGLRLLADLGLALDVPQARVDRARVQVPHGPLDVEDDDLCRVVRRREFDAMLAWAARDRGVELREGTHVTAIARDGDGVRVETDGPTYWARAVVGADGGGSVVRRSLVPGDGGVVARAIMTDVPVAASRWDGFGRRRYDFDFRPCPAGLRGYRWIFPCVIGGAPHANVGVYALPPVDGARLQRDLHALLHEIGATATNPSDGGSRCEPPIRWKAFPIRTLTRESVVAAPNALLVGDAAGVDPLMGEGISFALEYGALAAESIVRAQGTGDWSFEGYGRAVHAGPIGRKLRRLAIGAKLFYGRTGGLMFRVAAASTRAQAIGLKWYNGVDGWDERSAWQAVRVLCSRAPRGAA
jgi:menaquinone-9 beta-reductase